MKQHIWAIAFSVCLAGYTAFAALDTFAFASVYQANATQMNTSMFESASITNASSSDDSASSETSAQSAVAASSSASAQDATETSEDASATQSIATGTSADDSTSRHGHSGNKPGRQGDSPSRTNRATSSNDIASNDGSNTTSTATASAVSSLSGDLEYNDENVSITVSEHTVSGTAVYVADVTVSSAEYLKTAFADDTYGKNVTAAASETAAEHDAILAINGDNYGSREKGYVIRNGIVYRDVSDGGDVLCVLADGSFKIVDSSAVSAEQLVEDGVWQAFSFGPALVQDATVCVSEDDEVGKAKASNPRTAIGVISENHYVFVVSDGRTDESEGLSLHELAQFMQQLGVECAYNLDGGGSSTMVFEGSVVNNPTSNGTTIKERNVNDIIYIG